MKRGSWVQFDAQHKRVVAADLATPRDLAREATCVSLNDEQWTRIQEIEAGCARRVTSTDLREEKT